eukprot:CAMPEP_0178497394 /NCGR_PEP_ID=MMETSP0696-20121128/14657_1 /TAXON_ID=265572 /ORGANISM="Extubocellulus spinifer, Strain CCMP396" /LENGTH=390 /DNA_ID=CAMNT_0020125801 /DNA_START=66 /DNA_END=1238 /DNA_ORIENTATION=+
MLEQNRAPRSAILLAAAAIAAGLICTYALLDIGNSKASPTVLSSESQLTQLRSLQIQEDKIVHGQCARGNPDDLKERPLLIFKYSRTGSTWLAWTGNTVKLASGKNMVWTHEATKCDRKPEDKVATAEGTVAWLKEFFGRETDGKLINVAATHVRRSDGGMQSECLQNAGEDPDNLGVMIATLNPHISHSDTPEISEGQWDEIFEAAPNLAMGVLVRTNSVKRAISAIASHKQLALCGRKKLTGDEDCIKNLPTTINLNITELWSKIEESERKRVIVSEAAGQIAEKYGDGRIFCLSYESMQQDIVGEMRDLGEFLGSTIDEDSLQKLSEESVSYKRGSDDLSEYIENYKEVYESLSKNPCLIDQLEEDEPKNFPLCGVYTGEEDEEADQ